MGTYRPDPREGLHGVVDEGRAQQIAADSLANRPGSALRVATQQHLKRLHRARRLAGRLARAVPEMLALRHGDGPRYR